MTTTETVDRTRILEQNVSHYTAQGWRVVSQGSAQAQLAKGKPTSHVLHLLLTIITLGLWAIVWILVSAFGGERHLFLSVDDRGQVQTTRRR